MPVVDTWEAVVALLGGAVAVGAALAVFAAALRPR